MKGSTITKPRSKPPPAPDGRLFRNAAGNCLDAAAYGTTWKRAREHVPTPHELSAHLAERPYDLRHAGISF